MQQPRTGGRSIQDMINQILSKKQEDPASQVPEPADSVPGGDAMVRPPETVEGGDAMVWESQPSPKLDKVAEAREAGKVMQPDLSKGPTVGPKGAEPEITADLSKPQEWSGAGDYSYKYRPGREGMADGTITIYTPKGRQVNIGPSSEFWEPILAELQGGKIQPFKEPAKRPAQGSANPVGDAVSEAMGEAEVGSRFGQSDPYGESEQDILPARPPETDLYAESEQGPANEPPTSEQGPANEPPTSEQGSPSVAADAQRQLDLVASLEPIVDRDLKMKVAAAMFRQPINQLELLDLFAQLPPEQAEGVRSFIQKHLGGNAPEA